MAHPLEAVEPTVVEGGQGPLRDLRHHLEKEQVPTSERLPQGHVPAEERGMGPVASTLLCLERAGWDLDEVDIFELNEAFSSQSLACINELGIDPNKVNLDGGAISIGHPLGASGARITCKAASLLERTGSEKAIATMCIGGGMGIATALEKI